MKWSYFDTLVRYEELDQPAKRPVGRLPFRQHRTGQRCVVCGTDVCDTERSEVLVFRKQGILAATVCAFACLWLAGCGSRGNRADRVEPSAETPRGGGVGPDLRAGEPVGAGIHGEDGAEMALSWVSLAGEAPAEILLSSSNLSATIENLSAERIKVRLQVLIEVDGGKRMTQEMQATLPPSSTQDVDIDLSKALDKMEKKGRYSAVVKAYAQAKIAGGATTHAKLPPAYFHREDDGEVAAYNRPALLVSKAGGDLGKAGSASAENGEIPMAGGDVAAARAATGEEAAAVLAGRTMVAGRDE